MSRSILLIDDDLSLLSLHKRFFEREGWEVFEAETGEDGLKEYQARLPDIVLLDLHLPGMQGLNVLEILVAHGGTVILLTGNGRIQDAVEAMRLGAENFLTKPVALDHLGVAAERAMEKVSLIRANRLLAQSWADGHQAPTLGTSPRMQQLAEQAELLASSDAATVLLLGESGTGKGWLAEMMHSCSPRARGPFVELNCAGLTANLLESELFGHEQGAFTDAKSTKRGLFEIADGGTLFLDEIGELAPELQPKLLKVLETKTFRRVGGTKEIKVDTRLIAATNRDLAAEVSEGRFRSDLYYRLHVLPLTLPPLRERELEDVIGTTQFLLDELATRHRRANVRLSHAALGLLARYDWPGNVRQLRNVLERALTLSPGAEVILPQHLPAEVRQGVQQDLSNPFAEPAASLEEVERRHIQHVLKSLGGNRSKAAAVLGISRATLHNKLNRYSSLARA